MIDTIYIEEGVESHPRARGILSRFPDAVRVPCRRYGEVFNRRAQDFRVQKRNPALILARKRSSFVLDIPGTHGIGEGRGYYFSHLLNCPYDCRYCFLQGMFQSAHYVLFVNYEDFEEAIRERAREEPATFFSGYDCDSLAFEAVTGFVDRFVPFFDTVPDAWLELRTKSVGIRGLLGRDPSSRVVVAYSLTPDVVARAVEHGAPPVDRRIDALRRLGERGWPLGLRFDPLIHHQGFEKSYEELFRDVFQAVPGDRVHSVSLGSLRYPKNMFASMERLHPDEPLFAGPRGEAGGLVSYPDEIEATLHEFCVRRLRDWVEPEKIFPCRPREGSMAGTGEADAGKGTR